MNQKDLADSLLLIKLNLVEENQNEKALKMLKSLLARHPISAEAYRLIARTYFQKKDYEQSLDNYIKACLIEPDYIDCMFNIFVVSKFIGYENSLKKIDDAIKLIPKCIVLYVVKGHLLSFDRKSEEAIANYTEGINNNPTCWALYDKRANIYDSIGKLDEAIEDCENGIKFCPKISESPNMLVKIVCLYIDKRNFEKAAVHLYGLFNFIRECEKELLELFFCILDKKDLLRILDICKGQIDQHPEDEKTRLCYDGICLLLKKKSEFENKITA